MKPKCIDCGEVNDGFPLFDVCGKCITARRVLLDTLVADYRRELSRLTPNELKAHAQVMGQLREPL